MRCPACSAYIELGHPIITGCSECLRTYMQLRANFMQQGRKLPPLSNWTIKRCRELGIEVKLKP